MKRRTLLLTVVSITAASPGCGRRDAAAPGLEPGEAARRVTEEKAKAVTGRTLNAMSPETVGSLVPRLRVGMSLDEMNRLLAAGTRADPKTGEHTGTLVFGRGVVWLLDDQGRPLRDEQGEPRPDPTRWFSLLYLRDANLKVVFDRQDRILSWSPEPIAKLPKR